MEIERIARGSHDHHDHAPPTPIALPDARRMLRSAKLRVTTVRLRVIEALAASPEALEAQAVAARLGSGATDRVTVYRTLNALVEAGLAHRVDPGDRVFRFSLTSHEHCTHEHHNHEHPHLVCDGCGKVECMDDAEVVIRRKTGARARVESWRVKQQSVTVRGTCEGCVRSAPKRRA